MAFKKEIFLYSAILLPLVLIAIVLTQIPSQKTLDTPNAFLYAYLPNKNTYYCEQQIKFALLASDKSHLEPLTLNTQCGDIKFHIYQGKQNKSMDISFEEAKTLANQNRLKQLDANGFSVSSYCDIEANIGWWSWNSQYGICLINNNFQKRLHIKSSTNKNTYFVFLGWIISQEGSHE